jgi:hypothetical protein
MKIIVFFSAIVWMVKKTSTTSLNVGEQFSDEGFYENNCFFSAIVWMVKKTSTTSLNVGEQFSDEGFYKIY